MEWNDSKLIKVLKQNGVVVMPTDTLYGVVGRAQNKNVVERIYKMRKRNPEKPCIILIGDMNELQKFGIVLTPEQKKEIEKYLPDEALAEAGKEPTSFVLNCPDESLAYLHRDTKTLAFRIPAPPSLRELLLKTGPLIAPSANPEALLPAKTIEEAKEYFGDLVNLYVDGGEISGRASKLVKLHKDGSLSILRE